MRAKMWRGERVERRRSARAAWLASHAESAIVNCLHYAALPTTKILAGSRVHKYYNEEKRRKNNVTRVQR